MTWLLTTLSSSSGAAGWNLNGDVLVPTLAAVLTVGVGIWTYRHQQREKRRDQLRDVFSEALRAIADYQELPYLIRRRSDASPMSRDDITRHISDVQTRLDYYMAWISLESIEVSEPYKAVVRAARKEAGAQMTDAWNQQRLALDEDVPLGDAYVRNEAELARVACVEAMQERLRNR